MFEVIKRETMRLRGEIAMLMLSGLAFYIFGISRGNFENVIYKILLLAVASTAVHISRQVVWEYICIEDAIFGQEKFADVPVAMRCIVVGGVMFMYALLVYGILVAG